MNLIDVKTFFNMQVPRDVAEYGKYMGHIINFWVPATHCIHLMGKKQVKWKRIDRRINFSFPASAINWFINSYHWFNIVKLLWMYYSIHTVLLYNEWQLLAEVWNNYAICQLHLMERDRKPFPPRETTSCYFSCCPPGKTLSHADYRTSTPVVWCNTICAELPNIFGTFPCFHNQIFIILLTFFITGLQITCMCMQNNAKEIIRCCNYRVCVLSIKKSIN